ncbi:MAG: O-acetyl-ADP-ribose deacetylase [Dehalococcoidia bacterium]|nr:O-acetyl-ADP-ribose deacetylase [Dehalococcoidia bacterium]
MQYLIGKRTFVLEQGDITTQMVDAIVNAANSRLMGGGGVDGAIHRAGGPSIMQECRDIVSQYGRLPTGEAVSTTGGNLHAPYVIHTVGPIWHGGGNDEPLLLASAYRNSLLRAEHLRLVSIAFPSISTGAYGYPVGKASMVAIETVKEFLTASARSISKVVFVLFDTSTYTSYCHAAREVMSTPPH